MFQIKYLYLFTIMWCFTSDPVFATSLFDKKNFQQLTADKRAMKVGDTLTIMVLENAQAKSRSGNASAQDFSISAAANSPQGRWPYGVGLGTDQSGDAIISRNGFIKAQITAVVTAIDAHDNLVIRGTQNITIDGELQSIELKGRVRQSDILADNTLLSSRILDAKIIFTGEDALSDSDSEGLFEQLFNWFGF
ncbi:flagellar basal body L-ring protein FlgH [Pseudoalteromonas sp. MMG013]|uniref:flagellar basal body L-ring protein FlgH n=1 Tax=Pseudoalteromonas sp. MMG013 TaxID=2822687 RepID=UPI001B37DEEC|nr:flagellar basal body L-ring protein FlgH [Pseudoalteromonas sp. MMG013]MBQ4862957.1 flagellar basal body L-ring protein FlgH [Pseudoalteromonas sp. MMG013]